MLVREDKANLQGGSFSIRVPLKENIDSIWILLALTAISGQFDHFFSAFNNSICGVSINLRKRYFKRGLKRVEEEMYPLSSSHLSLARRCSPFGVPTPNRLTSPKSPIIRFPS
jgi:hypothetical protein